jgi:hypothetical protein
MGHLSTLCQGCCSKNQAYPLHINAERGLQCLPQWKTLQETVGDTAGVRWDRDGKFPTCWSRPENAQYGWVGTDLLPLNFLPSVQRFN